MRVRPAGVSDGELMRALAAGWRIEAVSARYAPVGGGSYHWAVHDRLGEQWFVTLDDLDTKPWLGNTRTATSEGLRAAMDTAFALRHHAGLGFVVAPVQAHGGGQTILPMGARYTVTVFPFADGTSGRFGEDPDPAERARLVDLLAALHRSTPVAVQASACHLSVPGRDYLETALLELDRPWRGGPFGERARAMITRTAGQIRQLLDSFDRLAGYVTTLEPVITHGEPHPANLMKAGDDTMLIDWDTVGLAPPERDLWMVTGDGDEESRRYAEATGRQPDPGALALYRIRWALDDLAYFVRRFRGRHSLTAETEHAWQSMGDTAAPDWLGRINPSGGNHGSVRRNYCPVDGW